MNHRSVLSCLLIAIVSVSIAADQAPPSSIDWDSFVTPPVEDRPWVRWWWPGNDVTEQELRREVDLLHDNFFGGAEIQAFDAALDPEASPDELKRRKSVGSESFYQHLAATLDQAQERGLRMDLNLGSGWPTGGMHVTPDQAMQTLAHGERQVLGPAPVLIRVPPPKRPVWQYAAWVGEHLLGEDMGMEYLPQDARLQAVVTARVIGGHRSPNLFNLHDSLILDPNSVQVITDRVTNNFITWTAPPGRWVIIAFYVMPDGQEVKLSAEPLPGLIVDHFNQAAVTCNLDFILGSRQILQPFFGKALRGFFNDSLEFETERHCTGDFLDQFQKRRGYDVTPLLPAVTLPMDDAYSFESSGIVSAPAYSYGDDLDARVQYDYSLTVSDLFIERFLQNSAHWARDRKLISRAQAYGLRIDTIRAAGASQVPETEQLYAGGSDLFLKIASSGAHLYHRNLVSAEAMVWFERDYMTTPVKIKVSADKLFTAGVNHLIYHGFPYRKNHDYGETRWHPFSSPWGGNFSSNLSEASPFFPYFKQLNRYIARCQRLLRKGKPKTDLLVYYPFLGFPNSFAYTDHQELLMNGRFGDLEPEVPQNYLITMTGKVFDTETRPAAAWLLTMAPLLDELEDQGYSWEWVNDESLRQAALTDDGKLEIRGNHYKALVIAETPTMDPAAIRNLADLSDRGAAFLLMGRLPSGQTGFKDHETNDPQVLAAMEKIMAASRTATYAVPGSSGRVLADRNVAPSLRIEPSDLSLRHIERVLDDGTRVFFIRNQAAAPALFHFSADGGCEGGFFANPWNGDKYRTALPSIPGSSGLGAIDSLGSIFLVCPAGGDPAAAGGEDAAEPYWAEKMRTVKVTETRPLPLELWTLTVEGDDVPGARFETTLTSLKDWREIEALRYSSSPGTYTARVELSPLQAGSIVEIDLGWLSGAAVVSVNGEQAGVLLIPSFGADITTYVRPGVNEIEVKIIPALRNRLLGKAAQGRHGYEQWKGREDTVIPTGLLGPARLLFFKPSNVKYRTRQLHMVEPL